MKKRLLSMLLVVCMVVAMLPMQVWAVTTTKYDGDGIEVYQTDEGDYILAVFEGATTQQELYAAFSSVMKAPVGGDIAGTKTFKYGDNKVYNLGVSTNLTNGQIIVQRSTGYTGSWYNLKTTYGDDTVFTVKVYYNVTVDLVDAPAGGGVSVGGVSRADNEIVEVYSTDGASLSVNAVEGYNVTVSLGETVITGQTSIAPTASATLKVQYVQADTAKTVTAQSSGSGTVLLDGAAMSSKEVAQGSSVTVTATPGTNCYVESITVDGIDVTDDATFASCVGSYTLSDVQADAAVVVAFAERILELKDAPYEVKYNKYYSVSDSVDAIENAILDAVVDQNATVGYSDGDMTIKVLGAYQSFSGYYALDFGIGRLSWGNLVFNDSTESVQLTLAGNDRYPQVSVSGINVSVSDSRDTVTISGTGTEVTYKVRTDDAAVETASKAAIEASALAAALPGDVDKSKVSYTYDVPSLGDLTHKAKDLTVTVTFAGDAKYQAKTGTVTVPVRGEFYAITWMNGDAELTTDYVEVGKTPSYQGTTPVKEDTAQWDYEFAGWNEEIVAVSGPAVYTAKFSQTLRSYTVKWTVDGVAVKTETLNYGEMPTAPDDPSKDDTAQYDYEFTGWDKAAVAVTGPAEYKATFSQTVRSYTVKWVNAGGTVIKTETLDYGEMPTAPATPSHDAPVEGQEYTFTGWTPAVGTVKGEVTYTAAYTNAAKTYTVTFSGEGVALEPATVGHGEAVLQPEIDREGFRLDGWYLGEEKYDFDAPVTDNITLTAKWVQQVTVSFDVAGIQPQTFDVNGKAAKPADPSEEGKVFLGWYLDGEKYDFETAVTKNIDLTAKWGDDENGNEIDDATEPRYTVTYTDGVEDEVFADQVTSGILTGLATPAFDSVNDPVRTGYLFGGWDKEIAAAVTADVTYTAVWIVDSNKNGVADSRETIPVTVGQNGALTINGESVTSGSYLYDSTTVSSLAVVATPNSGWYTDVSVTGAELTGSWAKTDVDSSWGWDNRHVYTGSFPVAVDGVYALDVTFGQRTVTVANDGAEVPFNPYKAAHIGSYSDYPAALAAAIETALAGGDKADVSIKIYVERTKSWAELNALWIGALNVGTEKIQVTWAETDKYPAVSGEFTVKLVDERAAAPLADADLGTIEFVNAGEVDTFLTNNAAQYNPNGLTVDIAIQEGYALPTERNDAKEVKYNVTFAGNETYKAASCVVTLTAQLRSDIALVTFAEGSGNAAIEGQTASDAGVYSLNGGETYTITATPAKGSYVKAIVVSAAGKEDQNLELSYASQKASASFVPEKSVDYTITVTYAPSAFTKAEEPTMSFRPGWTQPNGKDIYTTVITDPAYETGNVTVKYLARPATSVPVEIPAIGDLYAGGTLDIPLADLWLSVGETIPEVNVEKEKDKAVDAILAALAAKDYVTAGKLAVNLVGTLTEALKYYQAHAFGFQSTEKLTVTYASDVQTITDNTLVIHLVDDRAETTISGTNVPSGTLVYNLYTNADVLAAIAPVVMAGEKQVTTDRITVSDLEGADAGTHTVTIKFLGDKDHKPSEATVTVVVDKAPCSIDFDSQVVVYGTDYDFTLVKNPADVETVNFMVGLDLLDVDGKTVTPYVHVVLPGWLGEIIKSDTTLNGLKEDLPELVKLGVPQSAVDGIIAVLQEVQNTLNLDDLVVKIGGEMKPENIGLYLAGAVSVDANYETAYTVDYLVIVPDAKEAQLHWVYDDANGIITQAALKNNPGILGAYGTVEGESVDEITTATQYLLMQATVDANGELVFDLIQTDTEGLNNISANGAYVQLAYYMDDWGNEFYYALPIARPFLILPNTVNVTFKDLDGNENYDRIFTFDNQAHDIGAIEVTDRAGNVLPHDHLTVTYYGVQTNGQVYNSDKAPVHAGAYTATALYLERDEAGEIVNLGMALGVMLIKPAETATVVEDAIKAYDEDGYALADLIQVTTDSGVNPDTTILSASLAAEGDFSQDGFAAVEGNVNVDFPAWLDQILAEQYPQDFVDGVNAADVLEKFKSYEAKLTELGISAETITAVTNVLSKLPENAALTFHDDVVCTQVGVYAVMAVVTDSDHLPSADTGILVIVPTLEKDYLKFNYEDANNIFTQSLLAKIDLGASAYTDATYAVLDEEATANIVNLFFRVDETGSIVSEADVSKLANGAYIQVSYIPFQVDNQMVISDLIARPVIIVPDTLKVTFKDVNDQDNYLRKFTYDGQAHDIGRVEVSELDGTLVDTAKGTLTVTYLGVEGDGEGYRSTQAPSQAGLYTVIAAYVEKDGEKVLRSGAMVGGLLIEKAAMTFDLLDTTVDYNGQSQFVNVNNPENADYVSVTVDKEANVANLVLEDDLNALVDLLAENGIEVDTEYVLDDLLAKVHETLTKAEGVEMPEFAAAAFEQLLAKLKDVIPLSGTVTINGDGPVNVGEYQVYAAAYSANYASQLSEGALAIQPAQVTITVADAAKTYGEADPELTYTAEGIVEGDELAIVISREEGENAGKYAITATYTANDNYDVTVVDGTLTIEPAQVTITVNNASKFHGEEDPELTCTVTGLVGKDDLGIVVAREDKREDIGEYAITATYVSNDNYVVTVVDGTLVIKDKDGFLLDGSVEGNVLHISAENLSVNDKTANFLVATYKDGQLMEVHLVNDIAVEGKVTWTETNIELDGSVTEVKFFALDKAHCPLAELWSWTADANN